IFLSLPGVFVCVRFLKTFSLKAFLSFCFFSPQILQHIPLSDLSTLSHAKTRILHTVSMKGNAL
uniref:Uncharacterized protein n=1 Tax=Pavo cristatus TaxID=9049 RepID=A0A8C9FRH2_PAVCR